MNNDIQEIRYQVGEAWKGTYNAATTYGNANVVQDPTGLSVYRSLKPGNVGHPLTDTAWWFLIIDLSSIKEESDRIKALNDAIAADEAQRVENENGRVTAEQGRVDAENARLTAEQGRVTAEQQRVSAEQQRASQEQTRISHEQSRVTAEQGRVAAEAQRVQKEQLRENNEAQRVINETNRVAAEADRVAQYAADHQQAVADHTKAVEDHQQAVSDHEQAVTDHNTAVADHTQAGNDHTRAESDHSTAAADHTQAGTDHTQAESDHTRAESDHTTAAADHTQAVSDHNQAVQDHETLAPTVAQHTTQIAALQAIVEDLETIAEGYVRVAGSSSPALSYRSYKYHEQGGFGRESAFSLFYPCLVGTPLTGSGTEGKILHILQKLDYGHDIYGNARAIDGSEGDVMICNIEPYYRIMGKHTIENVEYDVFLMSRNPFTWQGIEAERVEKFGWAPDYCVSHQDSDNVTRMHSVYNADWDGSYSAPDSIVGKFIYTQDAETGVIGESYDADATVLGGAGGLHSTGIDLPTGEQRAMNNNPDTTKCVPFMNATAAGCENMQALLLAEGGTFDAHNATLMGSGFSSNDPATAAADWEESGIGAKNGVRLVDKDDVLKYYSLGTDAQSWTGKSAAFQLALMLNSWRNPFHVMEAHRAVCYAIKNDVHELEWFVFEGNKYKWRSVNGFNGPAQGEMTCVLWKMISSKCASNVKDPTDKTTSIEGNRIDFLISVALFHGMTTQVSPSWWTSGLIFTEDASQNYEAYMERDQESLIKSENGEIATSENFNFETLYKHVGSFTVGDGYRKNYSNDALMLPNTNANKTGGGLHTYVGAYNYFAGSAASANKKSVRGFRRGNFASNAGLSPLYVFAGGTPSNANTNIGFGTCCRIVD